MPAHVPTAGAMPLSAPAAMAPDPGERLMPGMRGLPPGLGPVALADIAGRRWHPAGGEMALPLLSMDLDAFAANAAVMGRVARASGAFLAPHAKTPMAPALARRLVEAGAWATSVADLRQAEIMLAGGLKRIVIANQIGGERALARLAALLSGFRDCEPFLFVDTPETVAGLEALWRARPELPPIGLLVEIGCGRGGAQDAGQVDAVLAAWTGTVPAVRLAGVAAYEGTLIRPAESETLAGLDALFERIAAALAAIRAVAGDGELILTIGGSSLFDQVIVRSRPLQAAGGLRLLLRSGACFFSDHGGIARRLDALVARGALKDVIGTENPFRPVLRLWAEVLSANAPGLAICGLGLRDASHDQGLPVPLRLWRGGQVQAELAGAATLEKLNDQHAFLRYERAGIRPGDVQPGDVQPGDVQPGDVVEFGISHPCTCLDKHAVLYGLGPDGVVQAAFLTRFG